MIILLDAVYKLGKLNKEKETLDKIDVLLDEKKIGAVILVEIREDSSGNFSYNKVFQENYDTENKVKYLYKRGSSRGTDITPSCLITDLDKTYNNKFLKWFDKNKKLNPLFEKLNDVILSNESNIFSDINNILNNINIKDSNILLSIVISKNDNQIHYLNDYEEFKDILINNSFEKYYKTGTKKIKGESVCYLCGENKEVYGLVSSAIGFAFSTPEKRGNVPGTIIENQWKLLPICGECALDLNAGKRYIEKYLDFSEFGLRYFVIPTFLLDSSKNFDKVDSILKIFKHEENLKSSELIKIENKLSRITKNINDYIEFKFLFYQSSNNAFDIIAYVESVTPTWLNELDKTQSKIAEYDYFHEENLKLIFTNNHNGDFIELINKNEKIYPCSENNWYKRFLRDFINSFSRKMYIDTVVDVLNNRKIDYNFLLSRFMSKIRSNWRNEEKYAIKISIIKSLMLIILFDDLDLIKGGKFMDSKNDEEFSIDLMLNSPSKKATFLLGVLTRKLMNIQYRELGSTPFYNKLWGLSLDEKKIQKLYPMVIDKLYQYDANYYSKLEKEITKNLAEANDNWNLNRDETSYYFVLGFTLHNYDKDNEGVELNE